MGVRLGPLGSAGAAGDAALAPDECLCSPPFEPIELACAAPGVRVGLRGPPDRFAGGGQRPDGDQQGALRVASGGAEPRTSSVCGLRRCTGSAGGRGPAARAGSAHCFARSGPRPTRLRACGGRRPWLRSRCAWRRSAYVSPRPFSPRPGVGLESGLPSVSLLLVVVVDSTGFPSPRRLEPSLPPADTRGHSYLGPALSTHTLRYSPKWRLLTPHRWPRPSLPTFWPGSRDMCGSTHNHTATAPHPRARRASSTSRAFSSAELQEAGLRDVQLDENGYVIGTLAGNGRAVTRSA